LAEICIKLRFIKKLQKSPSAGLSGGATQSLPMDGGVEELHGDPTVGPRPKVGTRGQKWKECQRWHAGEAQMQDNPKGGELDPPEGVRKCCMKNAPVFSCIIKRTREGCDHGSEVGQFIADETWKG